MFEEREVITLLLAIGVLVFIVFQQQTLRSVQNWPVLQTSFALLLASLACSVIEGVFAAPVYDLLNALQHICSAASAIMLAVWCWLTFVRRRGMP
jgi:hypothetical protein